MSTPPFWWVESLSLPSQIWQKSHFWRVKFTIWGVNDPSPSKPQPQARRSGRCTWYWKRFASPRRASRVHWGRWSSSSWRYSSGPPLDGFDQRESPGGSPIFRKSPFGCSENTQIWDWEDWSIPISLYFILFYHFVGVWEADSGIRFLDYLVATTLVLSAWSSSMMFQNGSDVSGLIPVTELSWKLQSHSYNRIENSRVL